MNHNTTTGTVLQALYILAWVAFIGLLIKGGTLLTAYLLQLFQPDALHELRLPQPLSELSRPQFGMYTSYIVARILVTWIIAYIAWQVIELLGHLDPAQPFTLDTARRMERISYLILLFWSSGFFVELFGGWLRKQDIAVQYSGSAPEILFLAGVVFLFARIFKKGVELQSEQELTI